MKLPESTDLHILYYVAEAFVSLTYLQKYNLGLDLGLLRPINQFDEEEELEKVIFNAMYPNKYKEFIDLVFEIKHANKPG